MISTLGEAALAFLAQGWSVFPCRDKHTPLVKWKRLQKEPPTPEDVRAWWENTPDAWIGVALGQASGVVRVDADSDQAYEELLKLGGLPPTLSFTTPSGGRGWLLRHIEGVTTDVMWKGRGEHQELRLQSDGAYTILPPSPGYGWTSDLPIAAIPRWLYLRAVENAIRSLEREMCPMIADPDKELVLDALSHIGKDRADEYTSWIRVGIALHSGGDQFLDHWKEWSKQSSKYKEGECEERWKTFNRNGRTTFRTILWMAKQDGWKSPKNIYEQLTDLGNARILARLGTGRIKHSEKWGWLAWDGVRWTQVDAEKAVQELQKVVLKVRYDAAIRSLTKHLASNKEAADYSKTTQRKISTLKAIRSHESGKHIRDARGLAESEPALTVDHQAFDKHPYLFNCPNGTLDLRTGTLREHDPSELLTGLCPTPYDPDAKCPRWERFLREVFDGDKDLVQWLQKLLGYCLTGIIREHILAIFHGDGRNGKSTLIKAILGVLGPDYSCVTPQKYLAQSKHEAHPTKVALLYGKRFVADLETGDGMKLDEEFIKRLTGGDPLQARRMREDFWEFMPTHKLVLATNHQPAVQGTDTAIWSRLKKVPFNVSFLGREEHKLDETLASEASGILRWMVEGCLRWQKEGLGEPSAVKVATQEYREDEDDVGRFLAECYEPDSKSRVRVEDLKDAYVKWCCKNAIAMLSNRSFGDTMKRKGYPLDSTRKYREGLRIRSSESDQSDQCSK